MNKDPGFMIRVRRETQGKLHAVEQALLAAYPTLKRQAQAPAGEISLWGRYKLALDTAALAAQVGELVWVVNGGYCALEVYRWEKGQWPGEGRIIEPAPAGSPANALGLSDPEVDAMMATWGYDEGEQYLARSIEQVLLTSAQRRILAEHDISPADVLNGRYPLALGDAINRMLRDWNDRLGRDYFVTTDWGRLIEAVEEGFDADLRTDADGFHLEPRS